MHFEISFFYLEYVVLALHRGLHVDRLGQERPLLLQLVRNPVPVSRGDGELVGVVAPLQELPLALLKGLELAEQVVEELKRQIQLETYLACGLTCQFHVNFFVLNHILIGWNYTAANTKIR